MAGTSYPNLRAALAEPHRRLPDSVIERVLARQGLEAGAVEDFWDDLGNVVASALPAVGGAVGSVIAPGVGTAIGAGLGSLAGSALHGAIGPGQQPAPAPPAVAPAAGMPSLQSLLAPGAAGAGAAPFPAPAAGAISSQQAIALLLQVLAHPQTLQALLAMLLGGAGSPTVTVGSAPVPVSAFTNLLSTLASQASEGYNQERGVSGYAEAAYYGGGPFAPRIDLASPEARAGALLNLLRESANSGALRARRQQRLATLAQALRRVG